MSKLIIETILAPAPQWPHNPNTPPVGSYDIPDRKAANRHRPILSDQTCSAKNGRSDSNGRADACVF